MLREIHPLTLSSGVVLTPKNLTSWRDNADHEANECRAELADFLEHWWNDCPYMPLQSSGSTGAPKTFHALKKHMRASARLSCQYLQLSAGQRVLLRLPLQYIAAKMMIVRCLVGGLTLYLRKPSSQIWEGLPPDALADFAPLVSLQASQASEQDLARIQTILLGGGAVPQALAQKLSRHEGAVYASYGMTETLSHIALRRLNGAEASANYTALSGVSLAQDEEGCLIITAPHLGIQNMQTNDLVELNQSGQFRILGRRDNIVNSGGIKLQAEEIEEKIHRATKLQTAALPYPHEQLGQCLALLWEGDPAAEQILQRAIQEELTAYQRPKFIVHTSQIPRTLSGKIARAAARQILQEGLIH